ncbi:MAG: penicillin-binding protein 2 [Bacteroidetes bacterium]|nr:MAG: penicillin-binding protein 2 [Bacteroidota bacterium]
MRKLLLFSIVILVGILFITRLFYLQVYSGETYNIYEDNAIRKVFHYPKRGYVYDRNQQLLVANQPSYDVMIIPREVEPLDTLEFCSLLKIEKEDFIKSFKRANRYSPRLPSVFLAHLSKEDYAYLSEKMRKYEGFYIQKRSLRDYQTSIGANVLGFIAEVNQKTIAKDQYYRMGDLIGKQGIELSYEKDLRGVKGVKFIQKDRFNRNLGPFKNGDFDTIPTAGKDITITIDANLQEYGELLMQNKIGGIVAIEPSTGEILSLVSAPSYNPNLLVGRQRSANYTKLHNDSIHLPLIDKGLLRMHEPGSPFKSLIALAALQEGVIDINTTITCHHGYTYGRNNRKMGCHCGGGKRKLILGISKSCNAYFANAYRKTIDKYDDASHAMDVWSNHIKSFGLGDYLGYDLSIGKTGNIPNGQYYNKWYPDFKWGSTTTISNAIGQGEILVTPIQLANMTAAIANRGYYYTPHIIKNIEGQEIDLKYKTRNQTTIDKQHFEPVIQGLFDVYDNGGTAYFLKVPEIEICGKTGTAENFTLIDGVRTQLTDHSIFVAFAPKDNPKIAIAVFVENGYYGARWAGRIASLMIEKYIKGEITLKQMEKLVLEKSLEEEYIKPYRGKPFKINY